MNLATVARSPIGRHVLIYTFGASALAVLRQARGVIEGGFQLLDHHLAGRHPGAVEALSGTEPDETEAPKVTGPADPQDPDAELRALVDQGAEIPPPPPAPPAG